VGAILTSPDKFFSSITSLQTNLPRVISTAELLSILEDIPPSGARTPPDCRMPSPEQHTPTTCHPP